MGIISREWEGMGTIRVISAHLRTRVIHERLKDVFTTRCYTNPRLPYLYILLGRDGIEEWN